MAELLEPRTLEPITRVGAGWTAALTLANVATFAAFFGPLQVLLAASAAFPDPRHVETVSGIALPLKRVPGFRQIQVSRRIMTRSGWPCAVVETVLPKDIQPRFAQSSCSVLCCRFVM